jgi:hypothetical protein
MKVPHETEGRLRGMYWVVRLGHVGGRCAGARRRCAHRRIGANHAGDRERPQSEAKGKIDIRGSGNDGASRPLGRIDRGAVKKW